MITSNKELKIIQIFIGELTPRIIRQIINEEKIDTIGTIETFNAFNSLHMEIGEILKEQEL